MGSDLFIRNAPYIFWHPRPAISPHSAPNLDFWIFGTTLGSIFDLDRSESGFSVEKINHNFWPKIFFRLLFYTKNLPQYFFVEFRPRNTNVPIWEKKTYIMNKSLDFKCPLRNLLDVLFKISGTLFSKILTHPILLKKFLKINLSKPDSSPMLSGRPYDLQQFK